MKLPTISGASAPQSIVLPYPPSYNRYWRTGSRGAHISKEGMDYKAAAANALLRYRVEKLNGPVVVHLNYYRPRKSGDLDNRIKQVLDALQGKCYDNDSQIVSIYAHRHEDKKNPRVEIRVEAL